MHAVAQRVRAQPEAAPRQDEYAFLVDSLLDRATLARAEREAVQSGVATHAVLLAAGWISQADYAAGLAQALGVEVALWDLVIDGDSAAMLEAEAAQGLPAVVRDSPCRVLSATSAPPHALGRRVALLRSRGLQVVLAPQSRTLLPDRLSQRPFAPTGPGTRELQTFSDQFTISDGNQVIELYHVEGLNHSDNMTIAYLPKEKIVVNADMYSPPAPGGNLPFVSNNAVVFYRNIKRLNLDVSQHVPIHGNPGAQADFERIVGPVAARTPVAGDGG